MSAGSDSLGSFETWPLCQNAADFFPPWLALLAMGFIYGPGVDVAKTEKDVSRRNIWIQLWIGIYRCYGADFCRSPALISADCIQYAACVSFVVACHGAFFSESLVLVPLRTLTVSAS